MRRRARWAASLAVVSMLVWNLHAQDSSAAARAKEERAAHARALSAGLSRIQFLRGKWSAALERPKGTDWAAAGSMRIDLDEAAGGKALQTRFIVNGYTYLMFFTYDADQSVYRITSLDDVSGLMDVYEGNFDSSGSLVVTNLESGTGYTHLGTRYHNRLRFAPTESKSWEWRVDGSGDGGASWHAQLRASVTPVPGDAAVHP